MSFLKIEVTQKGTLVIAECGRCGYFIDAHEVASWDFDQARDAMQDGTARCPECAIGKADATTFRDLGRQWYAGRYSVNGYLDCTDWNYGKNLRKLERELRDMYGDDD